MVQTFNFYIDDSGTRHPDHRVGKEPNHGKDWFAMGGVLLNSSHEDDTRLLYDKFITKWNITYPLHSSEIRSKKDNFSWIGKLPKTEEDIFFEELYQLLKHCRVLGQACVIDRHGYNHRYKEKYGKDIWLLCKTAFCIIMERAVKYSLSKKMKLRVFVEASDKKTDTLIKDYYSSLKETGMPFDQKNSSLYNPISAEQFRNTLYDLKIKEKSSPLIQLADLYLWPICIGGYDEGNRAYKRLKEDKKLIDCILSEEELPTLGIKYSCLKNKNPG